MMSSCAVESASRTNPDTPIHLYSNAWTDRSIQRMGPNVHIKSLSPLKIFAPYPAMTTWYRSYSWKKGFPLNNLSNGLRLALILRHGGTYLDTDMIIVKPLSQAPRHAVGVEVEQGELDKKIHGAGNLTVNTAAFVNFEPNNKFVQALATRFVEEFQGDTWGHNGPGLLTRTWNEYDIATRSEHVQLLAKELLYPVGWHEIDRLFDPIHLHEKIVRTVSGSSFAVHMWQSLLASHIQLADKDSVMSHLFKFACPTTHAEMFVPTRSTLSRMMPTPLLEFTSPTCTTSKVCNASLNITHPRVGTQYSQGDKIYIQFEVSVVESDMESFGSMVDEIGRLDVCTSMSKAPYTTWCVPMSSVRKGDSMLEVPHEGMEPGQHTLFALLRDRHTHEISRPAATTFNVDFRAWKLRTQGGEKFWRTLRAMERSNIMQRKNQKKNSKRRKDDERTINLINEINVINDVTNVLLIHDGTMNNNIDMPAFNFITRGLLEAVRTQQSSTTASSTASSTNIVPRLRVHGPFGPHHDTLYDVNMDLMSNIERKWGGHLHFDAILYLPPPWPEDNTSSFPAQVGALKHPLVLFRQAETSNAPLVIQRMTILGASVLLGTYEHQLSTLETKWKNMIAEEKDNDVVNTLHHHPSNILLAHLPHCVSSAVFSTRDATSSSTDSSRRDIDVLLTGSLNSYVYPHRKKWAEILQSTPTHLNIQILKHPGYVLRTEKEAEQQLLQYSDLLQRSKIVIVTPSVFGMSLAKYVEAQMAGALIVGGGMLPFERSGGYFDSFVINLNVDNTKPQKLMEQLEWWVAHPEERLKKTRAGKAHAMRQTWFNWLEWMRDTVVMYQKGRRGRWSPLTATGAAPPVSTQHRHSSFRKPLFQGVDENGKKLLHRRERRSDTFLSSLPADIKIGTKGCVASDQITDFFPPTWRSVSLDESNDWVDTVWFCNPLPRTMSTFSFSFEDISANTLPNVWIATNNKTNYCLHVKNTYPTTSHEFFMPCYALNVPEHRTNILSVADSVREHGGDLHFLIKPSEGSGGRGIRLASSASLAEVLRHHNPAAGAAHAERYEYAQIYLPNPMLLVSTKKRKFDLRVYALITSISPSMNFWVHRHGFARLSTSKYQAPTGSSFDTHDLTPHITNVHYQRNMPGYTVPKNQWDTCDQDTRSLKCILQQIEQEKGIHPETTRQKIRSAVGRSLLAASIPLSYPPCDGCYQIFGVDVLIREDGTPYVVELNSSPSIETSNPMADGNVLRKVYRDAWSMKLSSSSNDPTDDGDATTSRVKEWLLRSSSAPMLQSDEEEAALVETISEWCRRGAFELVMSTMDDPESVAAISSATFRVSSAAISVLKSIEEEELCTI